MATITQAVALGLLILFVAVSIPAAIDTGTSDSEIVTELNRTDTETVTQSLQVRLEDATDTDATVTLMDTKTGESVTQTIPVDGTENYNLSDDTVTVTVLSASNSAKTATLSIHYPRTYGWAQGTESVTNHMPLIFAALGFLIVMGAVGGALR